VPPAVVIVSHYHEDHHSHLRKLSLGLGPLADRVREVWVPAISPFSMALYLRILAFGALFRQGRVVLADKNLNLIFSKRDDLARQLTGPSGWFKQARLIEVATGHSSRCPQGMPGITIDVLTPPDWPRNLEHPLSEPAGRIRSIVSDPAVSARMTEAVRSMVEAANERPGFRRYLHDEDVNVQLLGDLGETVVRALGHAPTGEESTGSHDLQVLRLFLGVASNIPSGYGARVPPTALHPGDRLWVAGWKKVIRDSTHLFNVSAKFLGAGGTRFLLTGDADTRLWPLIRIGTKGETFDGVQIPHHGSEENVEWAMFTELDASRFVVSADKKNQWRHPSRRLADALTEAPPTSRAEVSLFCTNRHANCEIAPRTSRGCGVPPTDATAISLTKQQVEWVVAGARRPAMRCPQVGRLTRAVHSIAARIGLNEGQLLRVLDDINEAGVWLACLPPLVDVLRRVSGHLPDVRDFHLDMVGKRLVSIVNTEDSQSWAVQFDEYAAAIGGMSHDEWVAWD
jgi:hypothetical protein